MFCLWMSLWCVSGSVPVDIPVARDDVKTSMLADAIRLAMQRILGVLESRAVATAVHEQYILHSVQEYNVSDYTASFHSLQRMLVPTPMRDPYSGRIFMADYPVLQPVLTSTVLSHRTRLLLRLDALEIPPVSHDAATVRVESYETNWDFEDHALIGDDGSPAEPPLRILDSQQTCKMSPGRNDSKRLLSIQAEVVVIEDFDGFMGLAALILTNLSASSFEEGLQENRGNDVGADVEYLDVMSVNIFNYNHWAARKPLLIAEVRRYLPGVVGFQEVRALIKGDSQSARFQSEDLFDALPEYDWVFQPAMGWAENDGDDFVQEGLAIFSRYPILSHDFLLLSRDPTDGDDFHQRICLRTLLDTPIGRINFLNTHLSLSAKARDRTLREIGHWAKKFSDPAVLVGDFNMELQPENDILGSVFGWQDAWMALHSSQPEENSWTFNSWNPSKCIDFVKLLDLEALAINVVGTEGVPMSGYAPIGGISDMKGEMYASDHRFLLARLGSLR
eukprot:gb/GEZN01003239.1/.p1 GENE.gb/GEZN01003239.1/~~gb/GEZN01003239.1/.p1  ORF type:complete len:505 (+),score=60.59 gb/GEZN01003239.1/:529-2043(+)